MRKMTKRTEETGLTRLVGKQVFAVFATEIFEREPTENFVFFETMEELNEFLAEFEYIEELEELEIFHGILLTAKVLPADIPYQLDTIVVVENKDDAVKKCAMLLEDYQSDEVASLIEDIVKVNSGRNKLVKGTPACTIDNVFLFYAYVLQPTFTYWTHLRGIDGEEKEPLIDEEVLQREYVKKAQELMEEVNQITRRLEGWEKDLSNSK